MCVARHIQITQGSYFFAISEKKKLIYEVAFLHADKHESLPQVDTMILMGMVKHSEVLKIASLLCHYSISEKKSELKLIFCL